MMQSNFNHKSTLKTTVQARTKAKRQLLGSIVLLLCALVILFKISNNIESIPIDSDVIEVKNTNPNAQPTMKPVIQDTTVVADNTATNTNASGAVAGKAMDSESATVVQVAQQAKEQAESEVTTQTMTLADLKPRITVDEIKSKLSPEDILEGNTEASVVKRYYLQLIGLEDKEQITALKKQLAAHGYTPSIQTIVTPTTKVYRLRMGPYDSQSEANSYLTAIKDLMQQ